MAPKAPKLFIGGILGLLGLTVVVDLTQIVLATRTEDGLVTENYYRHGLRYDEARARELNRPGWKVALEPPQRAGDLERCVVTLRDRDAKPLTEAQVTLKLYRPTQAGHDQLVAMREVGAGRFEARVALPLGGYWDATVRISRGKDAYDYKQRIRVEAPRS